MLDVKQLHVRLAPCTLAFLLGEFSDATALDVARDATNNFHYRESTSLRAIMAWTAVLEASCPSTVKYKMYGMNDIAATTRDSKLDPGHL